MNLHELGMSTLLNVLYADALAAGVDRAELEGAFRPAPEATAAPIIPQAPHKRPPAWWGTAEENAADARRAADWAAEAVT